MMCANFHTNGIHIKPKSTLHDFATKAQPSGQLVPNSSQALKGSCETTEQSFVQIRLFMSKYLTLPFLTVTYRKLVL